MSARRRSSSLFGSDGRRLQKFWRARDNARAIRHMRSERASTTAIAAVDRASDTLERVDGSKMAARCGAASAASD